VKVFVTGAEGYIGSILAPWLEASGHDVTGFDAGFYNHARLYQDPAITKIPATIRRDIRSIEPADLEGFDAVVHLAELSNDPVGEHSPEVTFDINHQGSVKLATAAKAAGVPRFVYTSSCSVYGVAEGVVDESSPVSPQTAYAQCKVLVERDLTAMASDRFVPTFLRNATAYGASPSMRFDIVLNNLAGLAWTQRRIAMTSDGTPWRPLVHLRDICKAILCVLEAPAETVQSQVFNVGASNSNYQVRDIAEVVAGTFPGCELTYGPSSGDNRSYRVDFDKIHDRLPGYSCDWDIERGAAELLHIFQRVKMTENLFEHSAFTRLKSLSHLVESDQIDEHFYWEVL